jgi:phage-related protein
MLRREWDVQQRQIAEAVRRNVKIKNQRKSTVNNLDKATKMEEAIESAGRKLKRVITFQKPISSQVKDLEAKVDQAQKVRRSLIMKHRMSLEYDNESKSDRRSAVEEAPDAADTSISSE